MAGGATSMTVILGC